VIFPSTRWPLFGEKQAEAITTTVREGITGGVATKADLTKLETELKTELKWIKLIGGAILAVLILPWLAEILSSTEGSPPHGT